MGRYRLGEMEERARWGVNGGEGLGVRALDGARGASSPRRCLQRVARPPEAGSWVGRLGRPGCADYRGCRSVRGHGHWLVLRRREAAHTHKAHWGSHVCLPKQEAAGPDAGVHMARRTVGLQQGQSSPQQFSVYCHRRHGPSLPSHECARHLRGCGWLEVRARGITQKKSPLDSSHGGFPEEPGLWGHRTPLARPRPRCFQLCSPSGAVSGSCLCLPLCPPGSPHTPSAQGH